MHPPTEYRLYLYGPRGRPAVAQEHRNQLFSLHSKADVAQSPAKVVRDCNTGNCIYVPGAWHGSRMTDIRLRHPTTKRRSNLSRASAQDRTNPILPDDGTCALR
ncbi:uncharacterized protein MYCFIDRAFT_211084 [Pseudocercospora fijiensis CIRAD86]|uniref:Uncharacterized protein n=1 Tax=Pseudocercospora fijiensis (strain CIRAD86) TaxID=383855 RepID=M3AZC4_PSEFD|nr:uncharacterized protein MYCFIDRAFT_211084 [Pseudocercospora fijiensis CIRAD86]EME82557.1 hypothetical protein MYCFIDRAFT_211084 [Pseudocercospora fijiensis CIRAD86]